MLKWALLSLIVAVFAAFAQTAVVDSASQTLAKVLCYGSLTLFVLFVGLGGVSRRA